jgi:hypothetical protein
MSDRKTEVCDLLSYIIDFHVQYRNAMIDLRRKYEVALTKYFEEHELDAKSEIAEINKQPTSFAFNVENCVRFTDMLLSVKAHSNKLKIIKKLSEIRAKLESDRHCVLECISGSIITIR